MLEHASATRRFSQTAAGVIIGSGANTGASSQLFYMATPVPLLKGPAVTVSAGAFKTNQAGVATATTITPGATHTPNAISINGNSSGTVGQATLLQGGGGSGCDSRERGFLAPVSLTPKDSSP